MIRTLELGSVFYGVSFLCKLNISNLMKASMNDFFNYEREGFKIRPNVTEAHKKSWDSISRAGSFWTGKERVEIAEQARSSRVQRNQLPFNRTHPPSTLNKETLDAARTIAADAKKIDSSWARQLVSRLGSGAYVEIVSIVATVTAIDTFSEALGRPTEKLPSPNPGKSTGEQISNIADIGAYVPMLEPWKGPNVGRALSLVPEANSLFMSNVLQMYTSSGGGFSDMIWDGPLSRPQAELLAARVSAINECFY